MYSRDHAIISAVVGAALSLVLSLPFAWWTAVGYAVVVGVGIDFDHFLDARVVTGEWTALRRCLRNPRLVLFEQGEIFEPGELWPLQRLLSHHVIGGIAVAILWPVNEQFAIFTGAILYAHVLSDLIWDNRHLQQYHERVVAAEDEHERSTETYL